MSKTVGVILALRDKCSPQLNKIANKLGMTEKEAKRATQACKRLGQEMNKGLNKACKACKIGLVGIGAGMIALAKEGLKTAGSMEQYKVAFDTMLGSQEKSNALMKDIVKYAGTTPYKLDDVVKGTQRLLAFGIESENVIDRMGRLGDLSKGDSAILDRLTLAFGKIKAKGKASLEELNQLTEAG